MLRTLPSLLCVISFCSLSLSQDRVLVTNSRLELGTAEELTASVRCGDLDGDGDLDLVIANGRHWPQQNFILLNDGQARFSVVRPLGRDHSTTYAAEPVDVDGDGDLDIVTGNAMAPCHIFLNDGKASFLHGGQLGVISSIRSLSVSDLDGDGSQDLLTTSRGKPNLALLNNGSGRFDQTVQFGAVSDSTIDVAVADLNGDGWVELLLANRDRQENQLLSQGPKLHFTSSNLGESAEQSRGIAVADLDGDGNLDCVVGNIDQPNRIHFGDGSGGFTDEITFGKSDRYTYAVAITDLDLDGDGDVITAVVGGPNVAYINEGQGREFSESLFGEADAATYGLCVGDFDGDGFPDVAVANSGSKNRIFLNRPKLKVGNIKTSSKKSSATGTGRFDSKAVAQKTDDWPQFRGPGSMGVSDGFPLAATWNADDEDEIENHQILWRQSIPGLSHSSPVIVDDQLFVCSAVALEGDAPLKLGRSGASDAAEDFGVQEWKVYCFDKVTGDPRWEHTCRVGQPKVTRHAKATHANTTLAVEEDRIYAFFGSEGLYCLNLQGDLIWKRDLGVINISKYGIGWGYASSPAVSDGKVVLICDDPNRPFLVCLDALTGEEIWRVSREGETERNWSTPFILSSDTKETAQVVINGWPSVISYNLQDGSERWRIRGGGDNPVPTPFAIGEWIFLTSAHGDEAPIHVVNANVSGDLTDQRDTAPNDSFLWSVSRGGAYMSTPVVYDNLLYLGNSNGVLRCFDAWTGEKKYEERLGSGASIIGSLVAGDGKIYCPSENGTVYVVRAGETYQLEAANALGAPCFSTPAISGRVLYFRTTEEIVAIR